MKRNIELDIFFFTYSLNYSIKELTTSGNEKEVCKTFTTSFLLEFGYEKQAYEHL
jgi:hypothetical protein